MSLVNTFFYKETSHHLCVFRLILRQLVVHLLQHFILTLNSSDWTGCIFLESLLFLLEIDII